MVDPMSPSATCLDDVGNVFILPQASDSHSANDSFVGEASDAAWEADEPAPPSPQRTMSSNDDTPRSDGSGRQRRRKDILEPIIDLTEDLTFLSDVLENESKAATTSHLNGKTMSVQKTFERKRLPARPGRGTRLEAIVMNIHPGRYRAACSVSPNKKAKATSTSTWISSPPKASNIISSPPKDSVRLTSPQESVVRVSTPPTVLQKKSPSKPKSNAIASKASPTAKTKAASAPKRKRKKYRPSQSSSMFAPPEPEIKLKYINYKEERREHRADNFSPFVRVELKPSSLSLCTVVNDPEEEQPRLKKGQPSQGSSGAFIPGAVPSTSCLQLGRLSSHSKYHSSLVCCLCGKSANALDLGDLHGPYYPEGFRPSTKTPASIPGRNNNEEEEEKEDEEGFSDSDSSCNMKGRGGKSARLPGMWHHSAGPRLNQQGLLRKHCRWTGDSEPTGSPAAKRARTEAGAEAAGTPQNWYSAPVVPLEPCEYWLHEDCGIWSADVFLVKGKVYGLEEAVKVAQETTCSSCHNAGATLGCFFKGCPNKYHYRCALQSDCVLIEENFTMKCKKHRNKSFKSPPVTRRDDR
ncbi:retinoic acid-induced protein 1 [Aplochiton taeniatus]